MPGDFFERVFWATFWKGRKTLISLPNIDVSRRFKVENDGHNFLLLLVVLSGELLAPEGSWVQELAVRVPRNYYYVFFAVKLKERVKRLKAVNRMKLHQRQKSIKDIYSIYLQNMIIIIKI